MPTTPPGREGLILEPCKVEPPRVLPVGDDSRFTGNGLGLWDGGMACFYSGVVRFSQGEIPALPFQEKHF